MAKNIFARFWALWGLVSFVVTFLIIFLPSMMSHLFKDEKKRAGIFYRRIKMVDEHLAGDGGVSG